RCDSAPGGSWASSLLARAGGAFCADADDDAAFAGFKPWVAFQVEVFLGESVQVLDGALFGEFGSAADQDPALLWGLLMHHRRRDTGIAAQVPLLGATDGRVEDDAFAVPIDPDRGGLYRAIAA